MPEPEQSYQNHAKLVFGYHRATTVLLLVPFLWMARQAVTDPSVDRVMAVVLGAGVILAAYYTRAFPIGVQDRVIRLEERLRMQTVLPSDLADRVGELTTRQLIALRFASDEELPDLVRRVLAGELADRSEIKQAVKTWRADHQRI